MKKRRHTPEEAAAKLRQAHEMIAQGKLQSEAAKALGISVMTYHRWRKARAEPRAPSGAALENGKGAIERDLDARITELQVENSRLRRLVTDQLLEKMLLEETLGSRRAGS
jgi:transcriptional regulator with XRE-family HTH domain